MFCWYYKCCILIRSSCEALSIPEFVAVTSLYYCHRAFARGNSLDYRRTATACIFMACKARNL